MERGFNLNHEGSTRDSVFSALQRESLVGLDAARSATVKEELGARFPEQRQLIECIFGLRDFLFAQKNHARDREKIQEMTPDARQKFFIKFTEYRFLLTHFLIHESDREDVKNFWDAGTTIAKALGTAKEYKSLRQSTLSQVAGYKALEMLGQQPVLASPTEDALGGVDVWASEEKAVNVKGSFDKGPRVMTVDAVAFPAIETRGRARVYDIRGDGPLPPSNPIMKIERYAKAVGRSVKAFEMRIPYSAFDEVTGTPTPEIVDFFREQIA